MRRAAVIIFLLILMPFVAALADTYSMDQLVPFGVVEPVLETGAPVFQKASTKTQIDTLQEGTICQIQATQKISGTSWFKIRYFKTDGTEMIGYIVSGNFDQMTVAELISIMSDPETASYMQNFVGFTLFMDNETLPEPGSRGRFSFDSTPTAPTPAPTPTVMKSTYILNTSTRRFHYPDCPGVDDMKAKNKQEFTGTREEAISLGYKPCGRCNP